jgi:chromate transporter
MAIHIGFLRAGWPGLIVSGACFILPAALIVLTLAWAYVRFGSLPEVVWLLYGIKPVIIAIVMQALWGFTRTAIRGPLTAAAAGAVVLLSFLGYNEILLLFAAGIGVMLARHVPRRWSGAAGAACLSGPVLFDAASSLAAGTTMATGPAMSLWGLTAFFLKVGSILFGSGYVLLAFLRADLVQRWGWLTDQQLMDAIAIGQFTPGPVLTTATFIGYVLAGVPGAVLATCGIFLPGFVFVAASNPLIPRLRRSSWAAGFLDGVNVASLGLMAAVAWHLARAALVDGVTLALALAAAVLLFALRLNSAWLVLGGGVIGLVFRMLR